MKLLAISHTPHYNLNGKIAGWGSTVRELDHLAGLFDELVHLAPLYPGEAPESSLAYSAENIRFRPLRPSGGESLAAKLGILRSYPGYAKEILNELKKADAVHVRCPANLSLLAVLLLGLSRKPLYRWVKYAGNWRPNQNEPWSYTFQRWWLNKGLHHGIVSINGHWPDQPEHVYTFRNPCLTEKDLIAGKILTRNKELTLPIHLLFIGRLETAKGAGRILDIAQLLSSSGVDFRINFVGDGPERSVFESQAQQLNLEKMVKFLGWLPKPSLADYYSQAHFLLLPTNASEGWPKVLSEAMAYGVVPLAGAVSSIPQILQETGAGLALPPEDPEAFAQAIQNFLAEPERWKQASTSGVAAAPQFSYSQYLHSIRNTFMHAWQLSLPDDPLGEKQ